MLPVHLVLEAKFQETELIYMERLVKIIVWIILMWPQAHWPGITFKATA